MAHTDQLHRFLFEDKHVRGEIVQLEKTYADIIANHEYPEPVKQLIGELLSATSLLTATIKFEGEISVQLQGDGPVSYMVVNGNDKQEMRSVAKINGEIKEAGLEALIGKGAMIITITPEKGQRYQGIVALDKPTLAECLAQYFETSDQIPTKIWLFSDTQTLKTGGALVQLLPDAGSKEKQLDDFQHISTLTATIKREELLDLDVNEILRRLYHEEDVRLFEPQAVSFVCSCSEEKCLNALSSLSDEELKKHFEEHKTIEMNCEFCLYEYAITEEKLINLRRR